VRSISTTAHRLIGTWF